ncbi:calcineurin-binding protein cabin-1-like [Macrosteles quadrilineatus]|uniref:calcineurin-binding protein cabin-1-like n=1 Tax=Macrosteles quadrilineatus TaxID=74068 RepID=UPI0023E25F7A|nr:calcineurin-binding protein cabin-1-like [Macrosteles quadrilineatus]
MTSRFKALNLDSSEEIEYQNEALTKEALEEKATARYMEALQSQANEQWSKAEEIYQELLESEVLSNVSGRVTFINGRIKPSLEHLKYCCYQNLGHVLIAKNKLEDGLLLYEKALELDDTDLNLWYRIGLVGMKLVDLNVAISAFEKALEISPRHFPSLDNIISATYAQGGLLNCLYYIARALEYNPKYRKGLALKDRIFKDHPSMREYYVTFNPYPDYPLDPAEVSDVDPTEAEKYFSEVLKLREGQLPVKKETRATPSFTLPCRPTSWMQLALLLSAAHTQIVEEAPELDMYRPVGLLSERQFSDVDMEVGMDTDQLSADEEVDNIITEAVNEGEEAEPMGVRGKRRRSSPTAIEQLMSGKRRSTRVRNTTRKEEPTLARTLTCLLPNKLRFKSEDGKKDDEVVRWNEDSLDTMDMFRLFENKDFSGESRELELTNCLSEEEKNKVIKEEEYFKTDKEVEEVNNFLEKFTGMDIVTLVEQFVIALAGKWNLHWPTKLPDLYIQLYKNFLYHNPPEVGFPSLLKTEAEGAACILYGELLLDQWLAHGKSRGKPSPLSGSCMGGELPSLLLGDLHDLVLLGCDSEFAARSFWMHALMALYADDVHTAIHKLSLIKSHEKLDEIDLRLVNVTNHFIINRSTVETMLTTLNRKQMIDELVDLYQQDDCEQIVAILTEVLQPSRFSANLFQPALDRDAQYSLLLYTLWRMDRVEECMKWSEMFVNESVTQLLAAVAEDNAELRTKWLTIINCSNCLFVEGVYEECMKWSEMFVNESVTQLLAAVAEDNAELRTNGLTIINCSNCLFVEGVYEECMKWSEMFVNESVTQLLAAVAEDNAELRTKWLTIINNTLLCILTCINHKGPQVLDTLGENRLPRLVQSLIHVICRQIESGQLVDTQFGQLVETQFDLISPWMLLYEIICHSEDLNEVRPSDKAEERLPCSLRLLFTAHEYLGRRCWCCQEEAVILYQTLYQLQTLMDLYNPESEEFTVLSQQLEQIFYCLYGHPIKRNKPRYVHEHHVNGVELTWTRSHQVLSLLRPKELPTYDSSSKCSISADTETLLRRIIELVPSEMNPARLVEQMSKYIDRSADIIPQNDNPLPAEMADIYYLIADHYFKNKVWGKALKYYLLDVCNNSERVDSWACLALARGSILETKLNSCDALKCEEDFLKKALMSCRCYQTSLDIDSGLPTLWIEYGAFSYMVHSFCSRLLKQEQNLSLEMFDLLETQKENMIQTSLRCFTAANKLWYTEDGQEMQDERWLHHYMLGKIAEKKQEPASNYLSHYTKSLEFLHLNNATYPTLVTYNSPQFYAVEALEVYYRIHAVILKSLEQSEDKPLDPTLRKLFRETLDKVAASPFARKISRSEESEGAGTVKSTIYIDSEETRMAAVKRLMDSVLEMVEAEVDIKEAVVGKRAAEGEITLPAKRVKREDSDSKKHKKRSSTESSSDSESDSESSSSNSSSSSSDSEESSSEGKSGDDKKEGKSSEDETKETNWKEEQALLTTACLEALEECVRRFPEHYKSLYRLAHFYFRSKLRRNVDKARQLLLSEGGLFASRRHSNFFNGVWRIPSNEIDRPGSFASHMSRCVLLLVEVLRHGRDHKMLFDLALRLRDTPESDKKYLRDPEREELSNEALLLCLQALRKKMSDAKTVEEEKAAVIDVFKIYKRCVKQWEANKGQFATLLTDAYAQYKKEEGSVSVLDTAVKFCEREVTLQKAASNTPSTPQAAFSSPDASQASSPAPLNPPVPQQQKPPPMPLAPVRRGRGRPSNSSLRHKNPGSFKPRGTPGELEQFYRNIVTMQLNAMNQGKTNQTPATTSQALLKQMQMMNQAKASLNSSNQALLNQQMLTQQMMMYQQMLMQQQQAQTLLTNLKMNPSGSGQQKVSTANKPLSAADTLLAPSKVSVFSSQSVLPQNQSAMSKQAVKHQSPVASNAGAAANYQGMQNRYTPRPQVHKQTPAKQSPFQQKMAEPLVSLQHKLLSAKMSKTQVPSSTSTRPVANPTSVADRVNQFSKTLPAAALSSRGVSITPAKPPEIKIPKDITLGSGLSISPVGSSRTKSALSPSTSKEVTVTVLKSQDAKVSKPGSSVSVSYIDNKKPQLSPAGRNSPTATLRMGSGVTIVPAKSQPKPVQQAKPIPKADFSITLSKPASKKKDGNDVIILD